MKTCVVCFSPIEFRISCLSISRHEKQDAGFHFNQTPQNQLNKIEIEPKIGSQQCVTPCIARLTN